MNRKIIVFGATGKTGQLICKALASKNMTVNAFVRKSSAHKIEGMGCHVITGDAMNAKDVHQALSEGGFSDIIIALGSKDLKGSGIRSNGTKNILTALEKTADKPVIHVISALGVGESWAQLNWLGKLISNLLIKNTMNDHNGQEALIMNHSFPYHIVRPVGLKDGEAKGGVHVQNEGSMPSNFIQRSDVATFLVESLIENKTGVSGICQKV